MQKTLSLSFEKEDSQNICIPAVGYFSASVPSGTLVQAEQVVGRIEILKQSFLVTMPEGDMGQINWSTANPIHVAVSYGETIGAWLPADVAKQSTAKSQTKAAKGEAYRAPMEGLFYCRPDPESDTFVKVGQDLKPGDQVGLIEVMKTFYPIYFEGKKMQTVAAIKVKDAQAVEMGTPLFIFNS